MFSTCLARDEPQARALFTWWVAYEVAVAVREYFRAQGTKYMEFEIYVVVPGVVGRGREVRVGMGLVTHFISS